MSRASDQKRRDRRRASLVFAFTVGFAALPVSALAAPALQLNLPAAVGTHAHDIAPPDLVSATASPKPIAGVLRALVFLQPGAPVQPVKATRAGVDTSRVALLDDAGFRASLQKFVGQPISMRLIADIEAATAQWYRAKGRPFIAISTPPQEITTGVLQFEVVEFKLGEVTAAAPGRMSAAEATAAVRAPRGQPVDSKALSEDLDWLNRSPFRAIDAQFSPGAAFGDTDLKLNVTETRPYSLYAGYNNSGTAETDFNRYFIGAVVGDVPTINSVLADQLTGSPDFWYSNGRVFGQDLHPEYLSDAARLVVPTLPRQDIEGTISAIETNETTGPFTNRADVVEANFGYRAALSDFSALDGEAVGGIETRHEHSVTSFGSVPVIDNAADVLQVYFGYSDAWSTSAGKGTVDLTLHASPGNLTLGNSDAAALLYSAGRVSTTRYAYADIDVSEHVYLPGNWAFQTMMDGQVAGQPLPDTEQIALGGVSAVRGYSPDDGSYDAGVTIRNELRLPTIARGSLELSPFALLDAGYGLNAGAGAGQFAASAGAGIEVTASNFLAAFDVTEALVDAPSTKAGTWHLDASLKAQY